MRTLKLTHKQIEVICHALGIAEHKYYDLHNELKQTNNARGGSDVVDSLTADNGLFKASCTFADLQADIKDGLLDV